MQPCRRVQHVISFSEKNVYEVKRNAKCLAGALTSELIVFSYGWKLNWIELVDAKVG